MRFPQLCSPWRGTNKRMLHARIGSNARRMTSRRLLVGRQNTCALVSGSSVSRKWNGIKGGKRQQPEQESADVRLPSDSLLDPVQRHDAEAPEQPIGAEPYDEESEHAPVPQAGPER